MKPVPWLAVASTVLFVFPTASIRGQEAWPMPGSWLDEMPKTGIGIARPSVQKDLDLDQDQRRKANALSKEFGEANEKQFRKNLAAGAELQKLPAGQSRDDQWRALDLKSAQEQKNLDDEYAVRRMEFLTPTQRVRLQQIDLQFCGYHVYHDPGIAETLGLTESQRKKLQSIAEDGKRKAAAIEKGLPGRGKSQERVTKTRPILLELETKSLELLTDEQKKKLEDLKGKPFDFSDFNVRRKRENKPTT